MNFLGGGFQYFWYFHPGSLGKIPILTNIFQMGWNHQLDFAFQFKASSILDLKNPLVVFSSHAQI